MDHLASAAPCSAHHSFTAQSAHPGQQRAPRTARSSRVRLDGMGAKRLSWLVAWCWPGIIIHNHISWRLSIGRARPGGHMRGGGWHTQTIIAAAATGFIFNQVPNKLVDDKMLEAMLAMFVLAQRPSVKYGKHFSSNHDALCFKL